MALNFPILVGELIVRDINIMVKYLKHKKKEMRRPELEEQILDYIKTLYKATYIGRLTVDQEDQEDPVTHAIQRRYIFLMGVPSYMVPTTNIINIDTDEEFIDYIFEELRTRN